MKMVLFQYAMVVATGLTLIALSGCATYQSPPTRLDTIEARCLDEARGYHFDAQHASYIERCIRTKG